MTTMTGINDIKDKIKKLTFEDRNEMKPPTDITEEMAQVKEVKKNKPQNNKNINSLNLKNVDRRRASKNQVTAYLLDDELQMLEEIHFERRKQKIKTDRSTIVGEAIKMFYHKTVKQS